MGKRVIVVGGGASGFLAAIMAARNGASVTILEQNDKVGKKLLSTGNGRCNLTNQKQEAQFYHSSSPQFPQEVLQQFPLFETLSFFTSIGVYTKNKNGYFYPSSEQAASVVQLLKMQAEYWHVKIKLKEKVVKISKKGEEFTVETQTWKYTGEAVILCCGSCASAIEGADGSGYSLSLELGHHLIKPLPALVALKCKGNFFKWAGVRVEGAVSLAADHTVFLTERGELQLTDYGVSGIPVFQISRFAVRLLDEGVQPSVILDFMPDFTREELEAFLRRRKENCPYQSEKQLLIGLLPEKLIGVLAPKGCTIESIAANCKAWELPVKGSGSFAQAQVCSGGIDTLEIDAHTMESRKIKGLYFAGEVVDVDGACGGYNLQWAWSSGAVAGRHAALS
ncbi:MAG: NAD(P)/FAD-dependent oxidoreductase [Lachnospiraceae bacterium]|jgi:predicted Rossmann fold flavoprotein